MLEVIYRIYQVANEKTAKSNIDIKQCHFGYFDLPMLNRAYKVLVAKKRYFW